jgi:hypothetical protein
LIVIPGRLTALMRNADLLRRFEIDDELEFGRLLKGILAGLMPLRNCLLS